MLSTPSQPRESGDLSPFSLAESRAGSEWWRTAVIYQVYPRSFADSDGDGIGDLPGITARLGALQALGVDAVWISPFYPSPQRDGGYDVSDYCDVDPLFGTLADFDALLAEAHARGMRVIADLVPNHSSDRHPWFQAALAAGPGSPERARYHFRDGRGVGGNEPPNNWQSWFGGPAWTRLGGDDGQPGQWYLHLFDSSQPDFDWSSEEVREEFRRVLRFWLDRGLDGFRVDVASSLVKADGLPDIDPDADPQYEPHSGQPGVHEIFRDWRALLEGYPGDRILVAEAWVQPLSRRAEWVRPDEMHQAFNDLFDVWDAPALRARIDATLAAFSAVGAPASWVASNHDSVRHATSLSFPDAPYGGIGPRTPDVPDYDDCLPRARAQALLNLGLPGGAYVYQGEELGLPEVTEIPDELRQDPTFFRTQGEQYGRDGCRVPIPWEAEAPSYGFGPGPASWLPQPERWARLARDRQQGDPESVLSLYQAAIALRREHALGAGQLEWVDGHPDGVLAFRSAGVTVLVNMGESAAALPAGEILLASAPIHDRTLSPNTAVWMHS
ncbi:glycoside hydrolase family 13 protein [Microterricola viridarii]|uniref:Alpha-glucosidase n=1 Tax=Microterricola viridarii TaxID=412690 RepID=A0A1H1LSI7_9MICO|nr:glycoside hydrolase family 13 protein [Microterricola viridarii]SDR76945.1 alpha-glucosidase [Microterricola viridarii]